MIIKCTYDSGDEVITRFNGTFEEAQIYFLNKTFNLGTTGDDMQKCIDVKEVRNLRKLTCYGCDGNFTEGIWVDGRVWTFYCPECYEKNEEKFPSWKYAEKRYLTKDNNTRDSWGECFWCNSISHDSIIDYDDNGEPICPECKRAGAMVKL